MPGCPTGPADNSHSMDNDTSAASTSRGSAWSSGIPSLLAVYLAHVVVWIGGIRLLAGSGRVSFAHLDDASTPWIRQFVIPLSIVLVLQVLYVAREGLWAPGLRETDRIRRQWLWLPVGVLVVGAPALTVATEGWTPAGPTYLAGVVATVVLVGVCEELAFRGYLLVGARRTFRSELAAVAFTSVLFGFFHLPNALLGSPLPGEIVHVAQTAVLGLVFYALRRLSGTLILPMVVHAAWDLVVLQSNWDALSAVAG